MPGLPGPESGEQARLAQPAAAGDAGVQYSTHRLPGTVLSGCPALPPASPTYLFSATCQPAGALGTSFLLRFWPSPGLPAPSRLGHWAQRLPLRQEAPGPALKGLAFREAWLVIRVGLWSSLVAPLQVAPGCYLEAVPGLGEGGPPELPLSSRLQERLSRRGRSRGWPLLLWTLYPFLVCSAAAGVQEPAGRQVPSPACQAAAAWA